MVTTKLSASSADGSLLLHFDGQFLIITPKKPTRRNPPRKRIPVGSIAFVNFKPGQRMAMGDIDFVMTSGEVSSLNFFKEANEQFAGIRNAVEHAIDDYRVLNRLEPLPRTVSVAPTRLHSSSSINQLPSSIREVRQLES
jgi:hypothetical protein